MTRPETPTLSPCHPTAQHSALSTQQPAVQRADSTDSSSDGRWGFLLFLVVNAALFVRPAEIVPDLLGWQIYLALIVVCLVVAFPSVLRQLTPDMLLNRPITVCVLGMLAAIVLSLLSRGFIAEAVQSGFEFVKVVAYYLLLAGLINQPTRLRRFLFCLAIFCVVLTVLALLEYHGAIDLPMRSTIQDRATDAATGEAVFIGRLRGTGIFGDPNDLCLLLVVAILIGLYWLTEPGSGLWRLFWASTLAVLGYAFSLTFCAVGLSPCSWGCWCFSAHALAGRRRLFSALSSCRHCLHCSPAGRRNCRQTQQPGRRESDSGAMHWCASAAHHS